MAFRDGAIYGDITENQYVFGTNGQGRFAGIRLLASRNNATYGKSSTNQSNALRLLAIIKS